MPTSAQARPPAASRLAAACAAALLAALLLAPAAEATFPGANGRLAVAVDTCEFNPHLRALTIGGRDLGPLTRPCEIVDAENEVRRAVSDPEWHPDGSRLLAFQSSPAPASFISIAPDGSDPRTVPLPAPRQRVSFAPGGRRVAFERDDGIYTARLDGTGLRRVRATPFCRGPNRRRCSDADRPRFSPDGRRIAVEVHSTLPRAAVPSGIWLMSAATGRLLRRVAPFGAEVDWAPGGRRLVFRTRFQQREIEGGAAGGNLYTVRADGTRLRRIVHREGLAEIAPAFAPDGRSLAWISLDFGAGDVGFDIRASVWRLRLAGGAPRRVARIPSPYVEEGFWDRPQLAWQPRPR
ncbi:MAG TPA: hypothetical protein VN213_12970 [Solirubrobacteraceae bacterium]|nr:hypothetical protein [Solirubrobacteraceae bacterium]